MTQNAPPILSLLARLTGDDAADADAYADDVQDTIRGDLQNLLNTRSPWRPVPAGCPGLRGTIRGYGLPDFTSGAFNAQEQREALRADILAAIIAFEPRLTRVRVSLRATSGQPAPGIRLVIEAMLPTAAQPVPISFETQVDSATSDLWLSAADE